MLVQFKVQNYLSFQDEVTFSLVGYNPIKEHEGNLEKYNITYDPLGKCKILKSCVIYGANGSGKSNLLKGMGFFKKFILTSSNGNQATDEIDVLPFLLSIETEEEPSSFEMIFFIGSMRYRYGFETDREKIHAEWFFSLNNKPSAKERVLFTREFQDIECNTRSFKEGKGLEKTARPNALFLSVVAQLNGKIATSILSWFKTNFNSISGLERKTTPYTVKKFLKDKVFKKQVIEFFKSIQIGFDDVDIIEEGEIVENSLKKFPDELSSEAEELLNALKNFQKKTKTAAKEVTISTSHKQFNKAGRFVKYRELDFRLESNGTKKIFSLLGPIFDTIQKGKILIIDELDSRIHTLLTIELINFFHTKANASAQLIFASHDTNLLKKEYFRRDQIWFTEKDRLGSTDLYSLVEYKINQAKVRNDASFEKDYLLGKYGAIPFLGDIQKFKKDFLHEQKKEQDEEE